MRTNHTTRLALLLAILLLLTGCTQVPRGVDRETATQGFQTMAQSMIRYAADADGEAAITLIRQPAEGWDETAYMGAYNDYNLYGYSDYLFYTVPLDDRGVYWLGGIVNYGTEGEQTLSSYLLQPVSFTDGLCRIDESPKALELAAMPELYPQGMKDAMAAGRFFRKLNPSDLSFAVENFVIPGCYKADAYCLWQNTDGSLEAAVSLKNGTDAPRPVESITLSVFGSMGEEVLVCTDAAGITLDAGTSLNRILHIAPEQLTQELDPEAHYAVMIQS